MFIINIAQYVSDISRRLDAYETDSTRILLLCEISTKQFAPRISTHV